MCNIPGGGLFAPQEVAEKVDVCPQGAGIPDAPPAGFPFGGCGIHLPDRWTAPSFAENAGHDNSVYSEREAATPTPELAATASPLPTVEVATPTAAPTEEPILHSSQPEIISEEPMLDSVYMS